MIRTLHVLDHHLFTVEHHQGAGIFHHAYGRLHVQIQGMGKQLETSVAVCAIGHGTPTPILPWALSTPK